MTEQHEGDLFYGHGEPCADWQFAAVAPEARPREPLGPSPESLLAAPLQPPAKLWSAIEKQLRSDGLID